MPREKKSIYEPIQIAIRGHVDFMRRHPAARCFADAYEADREVGLAYLQAAKYLSTGSVNNWDVWIDKADALSEVFLDRFDGYFKDCR